MTWTVEWQMKGTRATVSPMSVVKSVMKMKRARFITGEIKVPTTAPIAAATGSVAACWMVA